MKDLSSKQKVLSCKLVAILVGSILFFAGAYWVVGSFDGHSVVDDGEVASFLDLLYFSVVSITTLGYGDFVPVGFSRIIASFQAVFGIVFIGYAISQVLSLRQSTLVEYSVNYSIHQTYNECIESLNDAKESIGDRRREIQNEILPSEMLFVYNRSNPFYSSLKSMQVINGYSSHLVGIAKIDELVKHVERAAHHVEELAGFSRKYLNLLQHKKVNWRKDRTLSMVLLLCDQIDIFVDQFVERTRYGSRPYKGGGMYRDIVKSISEDVRAKCR